MDIPSVLLPVVFLVRVPVAKSLPQVADTAVTQPEFEAHLSFKRINPEQSDRIDA